MAKFYCEDCEYYFILHGEKNNCPKCGISIDLSKLSIKQQLKDYYATTNTISDNIQLKYVGV